jgi:cohesin complex subunit SCC1
MFYSEIILAKKGTLAKVWLASHWDRKLTKAQIQSASIPASVGTSPYCWR